MILLLLIIAAALFVVERIWPANELPRVDSWWPRIIVINSIQFLIVVLAGRTWDLWFKSASIYKLEQHYGVYAQAFIAYFISTFVYYWWHRYRHESRFFWRLCHQLHHSPRRIELVTSFYKHPVEITLNSIISAILVFGILGCSVEAGAMYTVLTAVAEYFYHLNLKTPAWIGYIIQRPESHRIHHKYRHHTQNFADLPIWDILFGTFANGRSKVTCGYDDWREDRFEDMLLFRDLHAAGIEQIKPYSFLPTCIGCKKRFACAEQRNQPHPDESNNAN